MVQLLEVEEVEEVEEVDSLEVRYFQGEMVVRGAMEQ